MARLLKPLVLTLIILSLFACLSGCISTERLQGIVSERQDSIVQQLQTGHSDYLVIRGDSLDVQDEFVTASKLRSYFIPAIIYWEWNNDIRCDIDQKALSSYVSNRLLHYCGSEGVHDKLKGQVLEIELLNIPNTFMYENDGFAVILLVAWSTGGKEMVSPLPQSLVLKYRLLEDNKELKAGKIIIPAKDRANRNIMRSTRRLILNYVDSYIENLDKSCAEAVGKMKQEMYGL